MARATKNKKHPPERMLYVSEAPTRNQFYKPKRATKTWLERFGKHIISDSRPFLEERREYQIEFENACVDLVQEFIVNQDLDMLQICELADPENPPYSISLVLTRMPGKQAQFALLDSDRVMMPINHPSKVVRFWHLISTPEVLHTNKFLLPNEVLRPKIENPKANALLAKIIRFLELDRQSSISLQSYLLRNKESIYRALTTKFREAIQTSKNSPVATETEPEKIVPEPLPSNHR